MQRLFSAIDQHTRRLKPWSKQHKSQSAVVCILIITLLWPIIITYVIARFIHAKAGASTATKSFIVSLFGFGVLLNTAWVYGMAHPQPAPQKPVAQTTQEVPPPEPEQTQPVDVGPATPELYSIVEVIDGDTIKVDYDGKTETVRLIGMDTPETVDPRTTVQCFGIEASNRAKDLLSGESVQLETDDNQSERDKYGRLLRYVIFEDGTNFNKQMIADGYAYEYTHEVPYKYQQEFKAAQAEAQNGSKGLWAAGACDGQRTKPQPVTVPTPTTQQSTDCKIKGNISSSGEKIYHMPGQQYYDKTVISTNKGERYFCSETEAVNAGWRKSKV